MKLVIDIPEDVYEAKRALVANPKAMIWEVDEAIANGTPYEERPKGKWSEHEDYLGDTYYTCSNCGNDWCTIEGTPVDNMMNFCPNCGADMRGDIIYND